MDLRKEQQKALSHARGFAKSGNGTWTQLWLDRANQFLAVSERQVVYLQKMLDKAKMPHGA
jgi:hypothetical protein